MEYYCVRPPDREGWWLLLELLFIHSFQVRGGFLLFFGDGRGQGLGRPASEKQQLPPIPCKTLGESRSCFLLGYAVPAGMGRGLPDDVQAYLQGLRVLSLGTMDIWH